MSQKKADLCVYIMFTNLQISMYNMSQMTVLDCVQYLPELASRLRFGQLSIFSDIVWNQVKTIL